MRRPPLLFAALLLGGCSGEQSALDPAGVHSGAVLHLFGLFFWICLLAFALVIAFLAVAMLQARRVDAAQSERTEHDAIASRLLRGWIVFIIAGLLILTLGSYFTDRHLALAAPDTGQSNRVPIRIKLTGQQWWWQVEYEDPNASQQIRTANELHLPVGVPVHIRLESIDVIHSFWVPNLAGKQDMIPGRHNDIELLPTRAGHYRSQCAEFCGLQHAHMALDVVIEPMADWLKWRAQSIQPAKAPASAEEKAGYAYFMEHQCSACHSITGTPAFGTVGPDLTHFASRPSIGAGTMPNTRGHLEAWIANPQGVKEGNHMPYLAVPPDKLHALGAYLRSLS